MRAVRIRVQGADVCLLDLLQIFFAPCLGGDGEAARTPCTPTSFIATALTHPSLLVTGARGVTRFLDYLPLSVHVLTGMLSRSPFS